MSEILGKTLKEVRLQEKKNDYPDFRKQIISSVTHELRTPLAIVTSNVELLKKINYNADNRLVKEAFHLCEEAIKAMTRFVEELSFVHGFNKGEWKAEYKELDIVVFLENLIEKIPDYDRKRIEFKGHFKINKFSTDDYLLAIILKSVINNALKFSAEQVLLEVECSEQELIVRVKDQGIGISADEIDHVFEPFYRGSNVKMISGSGLGLTIVKRSMDLLNGMMEVTSFIDQGTTFNIKILNNGCQKNIDH